MLSVEDKVLSIKQAEQNKKQKTKKSEQQVLELFYYKIGTY